MDKYWHAFWNDKDFQKLLQQIQNSIFGQAHIVVSPDGFSNKIFSNLLAYALVCKNLCYCQKCEDCAKLDSGTHPDLKVFENPKGFSVVDVKEILDDVYKSAYSKNKVYVINNFDEATVPAQNKLLKILEEPPKNVYFVLNAQNTSNILATIMSRVIKHNLLPFDFEALAGLLENKDANLIQSAFEYSGGYLGKALDFVQNDNFQRVYNITFDILTNVKKSSQIIQYSEQIKKDDMQIFLQSLQIFLTDMLYIKTQNDGFVKSSYKSALFELAKEFSIAAIVQISQNIVVANQHLQANVNFAVVKDKLLLSVLESKYIYKDC